MDSGNVGLFLCFFIFRKAGLRSMIFNIGLEGYDMSNKTARFLQAFIGQQFAVWLTTDARLA